jgi:outer membrane protein OmpA-like peptidoglycan-associated protein
LFIAEPTDPATQSGRNMPLPLRSNRGTQEEALLPATPATIINALVKYRHVLLASTMFAIFIAPQLVRAFDGASGERRIMLAESAEDAKKKKEAPRGAPPPPPKQVAPPPPPPKQVAPPPPPQPRVVTPPPQPKVIQPPPPKVVQPPPPQIKKQEGPPPQFKQTVPQRGPGQPQQQQQTDQPKLTPQPKVVLPPKGPPPSPERGGPPPQQGQPKFVPGPGQLPQQGQPKFVPAPGQQPALAPKQPPGLPPAGTQTFGQPKVLPDARFRDVNQVRSERKQIKQGNQIVIVEPGNRRIIREGNRVFIRNDEGLRMRRWGNARFEVRGPERFTTVRRGSFDVVTVTDVNGRLLRRYRRGPDGREYILIDNRRRAGVALGVGAAAVAGLAIIVIARPRIGIPRDKYIVDARDAPPMAFYEAFEAPPVAPLERAYSLDEITDNVDLRDYVRSVDVNTINFATGSWEVSPDQIPLLQAIAEAMLKVIAENPSAIFMIEGHTDRVGSAEDNLSLSDRRAEAVSEILTSHFNVPPENMVTRGFGEQHPRVDTDGPSRENRRVQIRNITALLNGGVASADQPGGPGGPPGQDGPDGPEEGPPPGQR